MSSIIPKIKIGKPKGRDKLDLSFDCSTTANMGHIQPIMCREMVPNETFKVKVNSLIRLASMPLPTFGRMSMRIHHCYVPYHDLWEPFDCMLTGQHYTPASNPAFIPTAVPYFTMDSITKFLIMNYSDITICKSDNGVIGEPLTITMTKTSNITKQTFDTIAAAQQSDVDEINKAWNAVKSSSVSKFGSTGFACFLYGAGSTADDDYGVLNLGHFVAGVKYNETVKLSGDGQNVLYHLDGVALDPRGADLITQCGSNPSYYLLFKFKPILKRFRTVMIGCGYQFSPYNRVELSPLKLMAYYRAWFEIFRPKRELSFTDTSLNKLIMSMRGLNGSSLNSNTFWEDFLKSMIKDCFYYLPMDYFSMATTSPQMQPTETNFSITTQVGGVASNGQEYDQKQEVIAYTGQTSSTSRTPDVFITNNNSSNPLVMKMAMRLLTFANKNTVIGRSIRDWLKVHYGITSDYDSDGLYRIGSSRVNINVSDVMSTAESQEGFLGEYAGRGIGYGDSEKFDYTAKEFGCWLSLMVIVPESGYYQGYLAENRHLNRYQFFMPEFDALGHQVIERGEIMDDYNCDSPLWKPWDETDTTKGYKRKAAFGFVPRYSEYKVGRNIVNGDFSLAGLMNSMAPYTLDRRISAGTLFQAKAFSDGTLSDLTIDKPSFVPSVVYDNFRRIDPSDHLGQYNRIFNYTNNDIDHFLIHNVIEVTAIAPMKSLRSSFDTVQQGDDTIDVVKQ